MLEQAEVLSEQWAAGQGTDTDEHGLARTNTDRCGRGWTWWTWWTVWTKDWHGLTRTGTGQADAEERSSFTG